MAFKFTTIIFIIAHYVYPPEIIIKSLSSNILQCNTFLLSVTTISYKYSFGDIFQDRKLNMNIKRTEILC